MMDRSRPTDRRHPRRGPAPCMVGVAACPNCRPCTMACRCSCHRARHPSSLPRTDQLAGVESSLHHIGDLLDAFRCRHGYLFLSCADDGCPDQVDYIARQDAAVQEARDRLGSGEGWFRDGP